MQGPNSLSSCGYGEIITAKWPLEIDLCIADDTSGVRSFHTARSPGAGIKCAPTTSGATTIVSTNEPQKSKQHNISRAARDTLHKETSRKSDGAETRAFVCTSHLALTDLLCIEKIGILGVIFVMRAAGSLFLTSALPSACLPLTSACIACGFCV